MGWSEQTVDCMITRRVVTQECNCSLLRKSWTVPQGRQAPSSEPLTPWGRRGIPIAPGPHHIAFISLLLHFKWIHFFHRDAPQLRPSNLVDGSIKSLDCNSIGSKSCSGQAMPAPWSSWSKMGILVARPGQNPIARANNEASSGTVLAVLAFSCAFTN